MSTTTEQRTTELKLAVRDEELVQVTGCDLVVLLKAAFRLSRHQGLGILECVLPGANELTTEEAKNIIEHTSNVIYLLDVDYIKGKAVKLQVFRQNKNDQDWWIDSRWFDHQPAQFTKLMESIGLRLQ